MLKTHLLVVKPSDDPKTDDFKSRALDKREYLVIIKDNFC